MKFLSKSLILLALLGISSAFAQPALYVDGTHYETIAKPVRTADPNKVEVTEVFWYGCPHCYAFEPLINSWAEKLPSDVAFVRSPGIWSAIMEVHAQIYYVAESLGVLDKVHSVAFDNIHQKGNYLEDGEAVKAMFVGQGVSPEDFDKTWDSFAMTSAVKKAATRMREYGVSSVPCLIVNGKYLITINDSVKTQADMLKVVDYLVGKERKS
ncbi:MAG: thiol:disulfide interchange protein DsbA/DsbL [Pseudomonadota bacterium]